MVFYFFVFFFVEVKVKATKKNFSKLYCYKGFSILIIDVFISINKNYRLYKILSTCLRTFSLLIQINKYTRLISFFI